MKILNNICRTVMVLSIFIIVLITAVEIAAYGDWDFYRDEYEKNDVLSSVNMEMDDLMDVTHGMMKYLRGDRENLIIQTTIGGEQKEFFNDREKAHMADCRILFIAAIWIRRFCLLLIVLTAVIITAFNKKTKLEKAKYISSGIWKGIIAIAVCMGTLVTVIAINFDRAFITFHHIFFNNDMWLLDPDTDNLINIVPQTFFIDICIRIGVIFGILMILIFSMAIISERVIIKKLNSKYNQ